MGQRGDRAASVFLLVSLWVSATLIVGVVAWSAVARLGREGLPSSQSPLSQSDVRRELANVTDTTPITSAPPTTARPPTTTSTPPSHPTGTAPGQGTRRSTSWTIPGGQVGASCQGSAIHLFLYYPDDGWSMEVKDRGPDKITVEFSRGEEDSKLEAVCSNGVPTMESDDGDS